MKQMYIADPSEHKFLVNIANRPGTLSNILESVLGMLPGFCSDTLFVDILIHTSVNVHHPLGVPIF